MPNFVGRKWGQSAFGSPGGVVTWSIVGADENISRFPVGIGRSIAGESFMNFDFVQVFRDAAQEWARYGEIDLIQVEDKGGAAGVGKTADIRIFFGDIPGSTVGYGFFPGATTPAVSGDILLDALDRYNTDRDFFEGLVLHEFGHALGLDHVADNSVLTPIISVNALQPDDIEGIQGIYGVQDGAAGTYELKGARKFEFLDGPDGLIVNGNGLANVILGGFSDETIIGANGADTLMGRGGDDLLYGDSGKDVLIGGEGADTLDGGSGNDTVDYRESSGPVGLDMATPSNGSGEGRGDTLIDIEKVIGTEGNDTLRGNDAENRLIGIEGNDVLWGRGADDVLKGKDGDDTLNGGDDDDQLEGNSGNDLLQGGEGVDKLRGGSGDDTLEGGDGADKLRGGSDRDTIEGGAGDDNLGGGSQPDAFIFVDGHGHDRIVDFNAFNAEEIIDLSGISTINDFDGLRAASKNTFLGVKIETGDDSSILLQGVRLGMLDADEFIF